jgi:MFS family permease
VARLGVVVTLAAFAAMALATTLPRGAQLAVLCAGAVVFDLGVQAALIAHQTIVYGLAPAARSRLNVVLMVTMFLGMAAGSALGSLMLAHLGWRGVMGLAIAAAVAALAVRLRAEAMATAQA